MKGNVLRSGKVRLDPHERIKCVRCNIELYDRLSWRHHTDAKCDTFLSVSIGVRRKRCIRLSCLIEEGMVGSSHKRCETQRWALLHIVYTSMRILQIFLTTLQWRCPCLMNFSLAFKTIWKSLIPTRLTTQCWSTTSEENVIAQERRKPDSTSDGC
jgi:hypothetical protein